jgi:hypothetical protein
LKKRTNLLAQKNIQYLLIIALALVYAINSSPIYYDDSKGYLAMSFIRSCGYPLFLAFHKMLFGSYFVTGVIFTQVALSGFAIRFLINCIRKTVALHPWFSIIIAAVMMVPVFMGTKLGNTLLSESVAYPLYLAVIGHTLIGMVFRQNKNFYAALALSFIAIIVRGQFLFLIPLLLLAVLLTYSQFLFSRNTLLLVISCVAVPFVAVYTDIVFHKIEHNHATTTPWTGIQISTIPFFVSDENDAAIFKTQQQQDYFRHIYQKLKEKKLLYSQQPHNSKTIEFFFDNYTQICNHTLSENGLDFFPSTMTFDEKLIANDAMTSAMTLPLLKNNFKKCWVIYSANFIKGFDTSKHFLLMVIVLLLSLVALFKKENTISKFIVLLILAVIGNIALVAMAESTISRYTFYNNWVMIAIVLLLFQNTFYARRTNE